VKDRIVIYLLNDNQAIMIHRHSINITEGQRITFFFELFLKKYKSIQIKLLIFRFMQ
jgi:hypothetical protein